MEALKKIAAIVEAKPGDLIIAVTAKEQIPGTDAAALIAGQLRLELADQLKLVPKDRWEFLWITGFALFEWSPTEKAVVSAQHPFTGIVEEDISKLDDPSDEVRLSMRSKGYDLVLNGVELGSGSIRIHQQGLQDRVFKMLGLSEEQRRNPLWLLPRRTDLRNASARRHRSGSRPRGGAARWRKIDPRSDRIP